ncbi:MULTISPECIES: nucleoside 2-deoxyribosyltransferase [Exiguobacterium]|uniref:Nucleoside 2-deoxyribosyltransferase n=1 Tax=Exiguobacterium aurantiacum TaxID=33987 RepID=A0A377FUF6_9BACL|nr:nucleoside 2-deoxyribosyltransferase [Exiguobacterium aurantiacum]STO08194.1 Nucleoside 2-deoxyribosyltransferase [Exiguobacterium aurantiacum]
MHYYIGSGFNNIENVRRLRDLLTAQGHTHTYDWMRNARADSVDVLRDIGEKERDAIKNSDFVVILLPAGKGSHVELGIAIGSGVPVFLHDTTDSMTNVETTSTFYHVAHVVQLSGDLEDVPTQVDAYFSTKSS